MEKQIELNHIVKAYGARKIFQDLNISIEKGELVAIVGKSGEGKTTLLNIIGGIEPFDSGELIVQGIKNPAVDKASGIRLLRSEVSFLFQNFALIDECSVDKNLDLALKYVKQDRARKEKQKEDVLEKVGLIGYRNRPVYELSGGEQQRVAIARVMLKPTSILLADEPTGSLDIENRNLVISLLKDLNSQGITVVIVTHDEWVAACCSRTIRI